MNRTKYGSICGVLGICCNGLLFAAKLIIGLLSGSISIMADAFNNLSDAASSIVTLAGFRMAAKPADREHPFGHGRMEYVAGLIVSFLMLLVGFELGKNSVEKIFHPVAISFGWWSIGILLGSIVVKLWMCFFNRKIGKKIQSETLLATAKDSLNDALTTGAILLSVIVMRLTTWNIDGYVGLLVAVYILISGVMTMKDTLNPILGQLPEKEMIAGMEEVLLSYDEIIGVHDFLIHNYGPGKWIASVHAEVHASSDILQAHDSIDMAEREVAKKYPVLLTIHMDPVETNNERVEALKTLAKEIAQSIHPAITIHDFRIVDGPTHTNLIFDMVNPVESGFSAIELRQAFEQKLADISEKYYAVITVDQSYLG